ncbi:MAG: hypothetical protein WBP45_15990 [Daejeonella sp.]
MNLKQTILVLFVTALTIAGCKKSKSDAPDLISTTLSFDQLTYAKIAEQDKDSKFTNANIVATTAAAGNVLKPGAVILYKTNLGNYGKIKVISIDANYLLTIDLITYNSNDPNNVVEAAKKNGLAIGIGYYCDLDEGIKTVSSSKGDIFWNKSDQTDANLTPNTNTVFHLYSN